MKIKLGQKARDLITGFEGIVTQRCECIDGSVQYMLEKQTTERSEAVWLEDNRLAITDERVISVPQREQEE